MIRWPATNGRGFARSWGSRLVDLGEVGHLNPVSGYGDWPAADRLIAELDVAASPCWLKQRLTA